MLNRCLVLLLLLLCSSVASAPSQASTLDRERDPVVLTGSDLPLLLGLAPSSVVAFRYQAGWQQIPVQIDERDLVDLDESYDGQGTSGPTGVYVTQYSDPGTFTGADSNPQFDADDELVFMAFDAGNQAVGEEPAGVVPGSGVSLRVSDPLDAGVGYVYLFETDGSLDPGAGQQYVSYGFDVIGCSNYLSCYDIGRDNAEDSTVTTSSYSHHFSRELPSRRYTRWESRCSEQRFSRAPRPRSSRREGGGGVKWM